MQKKDMNMEYLKEDNIPCPSINFREKIISGLNPFYYTRELLLSAEINQCDL